MFVSQKFIDTRTGEIVTSVPLSQIQYFEEYDGPLQKGDFDIRLANHMTNAGDHASTADAGDTAVTMPSEKGKRAKEYAFDCKLFGALRLTAPSKAEAEETIRELLNCADANLGTWPDGSPILAEVSLDGELDCFEIDGEEVTA